MAPRTVLAGDSCTTVAHRLKKNAVRAAIERLPDAQQREVLRLIYMEGLSQVDVGRIIKRDRPRVFRIHQAGMETVQKLLLLGGALEKESVEQTVAHLPKRSQREVLLALYRDRLDYRRTRLKFGFNAQELNELHQAALDALSQRGVSCGAFGAFYRSFVIFLTLPLPSHCAGA